MVRIFLASFVLCVFTLSANAEGGKEGEHPLVRALITKESGGNDRAIGDRNLAQKAYGCLQIRQPAVDDVNRRFGTNYRAEDCLGNRELSVWIFWKYMEIYATEARLGRKPTFEDGARIWNGGPVGCFNDGAINKNGDKPRDLEKRERIARLQKNALRYWQGVEKILASQNGS